MVGTTNVYDAANQHDFVAMHAWYNGQLRARYYRQIVSPVETAIHGLRGNQGPHRCKTVVQGSPQSLQTPMRRWGH